MLMHKNVERVASKVPKKSLKPSFGSELRLDWANCDKSHQCVCVCVFALSHTRLSLSLKGTIVPAGLCPETPSASSSHTNSCTERYTHTDLQTNSNKASNLLHKHQFMSLFLSVTPLNGVEASIKWATLICRSAKHPSHSFCTRNSHYLLTYLMLYCQ